jgi:hypothetical protein
MTHTIQYNRIHNTLEFIFRPSETAITTAFKKVFPVREFTKDGYLWRVPLEGDGSTLRGMVNEFVSYMKHSGFTIEVLETVESALSVLENFRAENVRLSREGLAEHDILKHSFPDFTPAQNATAEYICRNGSNGVINADPETFDPRVTTWAGVSLGQWFPSLILCSDPARWSWGVMIKKRTRHNVLVLSDEQKIFREITGDIDAESTAFSVCIENFGNMQAHVNWLCAVPWKSVILDGSHNIRNGRSPQAVAILDIVKHIDKRIATFGDDPFSQPYKLLPTLESIGRLEEFGGRVAFLERYQSAWFMRKNPDGSLSEGIGDPSNLDELERKLRETCIVRHTEEK